MTDPRGFTDGDAWGGRPVARRVADVVPRCRAVITGTVSSVRAARWRGVQTCICALDDGTGTIELRFTGRSRVPGMAEGTRCSAEGTCMAEAGDYVLWNPLLYLEGVSGAIHLPGVDTRPPPARAPGAAPGSSRPPAAPPGPEPVRDEPRRAPQVRGPEPIEVDRDLAEAVAPAGQFRIYLGAVAGVGKTYAMLNEAQRRRRRGADIVIGFVECHQRVHTEELLEGFEIVPRKVVHYRGARFEEMDLDAVLARQPAVALVDELAHTNVPGSGPHEKRWQDVLDLLDAGIAVITTVNIQHLESLADAVERITGVAVRERVPDWVVRKADQIELVDSSPEQLRRRMLHGNIYPREKIPEALTHFFRTENLTALRELALRFLADETEEELLEYLQRHAVPELWETTERIMVGVTGAPGSDAVMRRAARIAQRVKAELDVVHIVSSDASSGGRAHLDDLRRLAADLGAHWHELRADDAVQAMLDLAQAQQTTQIVLGSSRRSRWHELTKGNFLRRIVREASDRDVDVHIIARRPAGPLAADESAEES